MASTISDTFLDPHRRVLLALLVLAVVVAVVLSAPAAAHAVQTDFFSMDASQESFLSEMAIHPSIVRSGSKVYMAWQGTGYDAQIAVYDEASGDWTGPVHAGSARR